MFIENTLNFNRFSAFQRPKRKHLTEITFCGPQIYFVALIENHSYTKIVIVIISCRAVIDANSSSSSKLQMVDVANCFDFERSAS